MISEVESEFIITIASRWLYTLWFSFILSSVFNFLCLALIIIHYHTQKTKEDINWTKDKIELQRIHASPNIQRALMEYEFKDHTIKLTNILLQCFTLPLLSKINLCPDDSFSYIGQNGRTFTHNKEAPWRAIQAWTLHKSATIREKRDESGEVYSLKSLFRNTHRLLF